MKKQKLVSKVTLASLILSLTLVTTGPSVIQAGEVSQNLKQANLNTIDNMPNQPSNYKIIDWLERGRALNDFVFDYKATDFNKKTEFSIKDGREFSTIYRDDRYGGYMIPAFYGENRPLIDKPEKNHYGPDDQESISVTSALLAASLMGIDMNKPLPNELKGKVSQDVKDKDALDYQYETYLDNALKFFWTKGGTNIFTNVPNGSMSELQNMPGAYQAFDDFWYMLIANQNFFRLAEMNPDWRPELVQELEEKTADKMVAMVDILGGENCDFNIQGFDMMNMKVVTTANRKQPDGAVGTANILYYAHKIFKESNPEKAATYLKYAKYCMDYIDKLDRNPYYENMLIDAVYLATMMNAEQGTNYNTDKYLSWITTTSSSSVRNWGGVGYSQDGIDAYGLTGEPNNGYSYFFNSIYPMTSILPAAKYDPSYARMAGKWAINIANSSKYFLPSEWDESHQTDGDYISKEEGKLMAYESLRKSDNGKNFFATGDAKQNATSGWMAGANTTNFGLYGGFYTGFLGALIQETNVSNILQLDCNKTDYFQDEMYQTYLYYNPNLEAKMVEIDLGKESYDLYESTTGRYLAKNVSGKQSFKLLADSASVLVLAPANSQVEVKGDTTFINNKLVSSSRAERLPQPGTQSVSSIEISGKDEATFSSQQLDFTAKVEPSDVEDNRVKWSVESEDGSESLLAEIDKNGKLTAKKDGTVYVVAKALDGSNVSARKKVELSGQSIPSIALGKKVTTSSKQGDFSGALVVDGDLKTRWIADSNDKNPWLMVDLERETIINSLVLAWEGARPPKYRVETSNDGQNWNLVEKISDEGNSEKTVIIQPTEKVSGRYVRIYTEERSRWGASLYELNIAGSVVIDQAVTAIDVLSETGVNEITTKNLPLKLTAKVMPEQASDKRIKWAVYNEDGQTTDIASINENGILSPLKNGRVKVVAKAVDGSGQVGELLIDITGQDAINLAENQKVSASHSESSNIPSFAVDGSLSSRWSSGRDNHSDSLTVDLGQLEAVNKVVLYWEAAYGKQYKIQGSTDGTTFTDLAINNDGQGNHDVLTFETTTIRYIRMQGVKAATSYGFSLWEFEVYCDAEKGDKAKLQELYNQYSELSEGDFEATSFAKFKEQLAYAQTILAKNDANQEEIDEAFQRLSTSVEQLISLEEILPESIGLDVTGLKTIKVGKTLNLNVTISPENTTNKKITWLVDKPDLITIDEHNVVHANKIGLAKVTVQTNNGKTASLTIRVTK